MLPCGLHRYNPLPRCNYNKCNFFWYRLLLFLFLPKKITKKIPLDVILWKLNLWWKWFSCDRSALRSLQLKKKTIIIDNNLSHVSGFVRSASTISSGCTASGASSLMGFSFSSSSALRTVTLTRCPSCCSCCMMCEAMKPVPPVTSTTVKGSVNYTYSYFQQPAVLIHYCKNNWNVFRALPLENVVYTRFTYYKTDYELYYRSMNFKANESF